MRRIHNVASAGSTPARNNGRHPHNGSTSAASSAASRYPTAHADCIRPIALPRCCAGHVSATSTDPAAHSPPSPMPTTERQNTSSPTVREVAVNAVKAENARMDHISARARP